MLLFVSVEVLHTHAAKRVKDRNCYVGGERVPQNLVMNVQFGGILLPAESIDGHSPPNTTILHQEVKHRDPVGQGGDAKDVAGKL